VLLAATIWIVRRPAPAGSGVQLGLRQPQGQDVTLPPEGRTAQMEPGIRPRSTGRAIEQRVAGVSTGRRAAPRTTVDAQAGGVESTAGEATGIEPVEESSPIPPIAVPPIELPPPAAGMTFVTVPPIEIRRIEVPLLDEQGDRERPPSPGEKAQSPKPRSQAK
jgi:hypothetical protein